MKNLKKSFISLILAVCLIIPCVFMLSACGKDKTPEAPQPFSVKGLKLVGTSEAVIIWNENATQQHKEELWEGLGVANDNELLEKFSEDAQEYESYWIEFKEDGTFEFMQGSLITGYYVQSEDLKTIKFYNDAECENPKSYIVFDFFNGSFCQDVAAGWDGNWELSLYLTFKKA